jgi:hypothetical protein
MGSVKPPYFAAYERYSKRNGIRDLSPETSRQRDLAKAQRRQVRKRENIRQDNRIGEMKN